MRRSFLTAAAVLVTTVACTAQPIAPAASPAGEPEAAAEPAAASGHPRIWITSEDVPALRQRAASGDPMWTDGLARAAERAEQAVASGEVREGDGGGTTWEETFSESYAELFAFLSLVSPDSAKRAEYGRLARDLVMRVIDEAVKGPADGAPFRDPSFATSDRSRWTGEGFAVTVDWAYPYFTSADKEKVRRVFARWADENERAETTTYNHPEPKGVTRDPSLTADRKRVRYAGNNYYAAHMRNIGLMALALDEADDPDGSVRGHLDRATGAWLYVIDHLLRTDARGGMLPEGLQYSPQTAGYIAQFLLALETAGEADSDRHGPAVDWDGNPFWKEFFAALVHSLSPAPAWYGDGERYEIPDLIGATAPLALHHDRRGNPGDAALARWIEQDIVAGSRDAILERAANPDDWLTSILSFLMFPAGVQVGPDPRPAMTTSRVADGLGAHLSRTGWGERATSFTHRLGFISVDHQHGDGNQIELYRNGEWLTKERTGYGDNIAASDYHNTVAIENDRPAHIGDYRDALWERGSQWLYGSATGDGRVVARSEGNGYTAITGDATALYNSDHEEVHDVVHASRSVVWLQPDVVVTYDRAETKTAGRFKRFWLNLPAAARVEGRTAAVATPGGQSLHVTTLLPAGAVPRSEQAEPLEEESEPAEGDPMTHRLRVEAPGDPQSTRFLHVLSAANGAKAPLPTGLVRSIAGEPYEGAVAGDTAVLFPLHIATDVSATEFVLPSGVARSVITGLRPDSWYTVATDPHAGGTRVSITAGGPVRSDGGGVLMIDG